MTALSRSGNKTKIAEEIINYFPHHSIYYEMFFGVGGLFFNKPLAKYNCVNDRDENICNFYWVVLKKFEEFSDLLNITPLSSDLLKKFKENQNILTDVEKAVYFWLLSNITFLGKPGSLRSRVTDNSKQQSFKEIKKELPWLKNAMIFNKDFRDFYKLIFSNNPKEFHKVLVYADPPYLKTRNNYSEKWSVDDLKDLLSMANEKRVNFCISEQNSDELQTLVSFYPNLKLIPILNKRSLLKNNQEVLIVNYNINKLF